MKYVLIIIIKVYWALIPSRWRRKCLFRESCSRLAYRVSRQEGFLAGMRVIMSRYRQCRPGYKLGFNSVTQHIEIRLSDGTVVPSEMLRDDLVQSPK